MEKKNNLKTYVMMIKYGIGVKISVAIMILFVFGGIAWELVIVFLAPVGLLRFVLDVGALLLLCAAMYPAQLMLSANLSSMVQTSAYKKKMQTTAPALLCLGCNLAAMAVVLLIRGVGAWVMPQRAAEIMGGMVTVGLLVFGIDILAAMLYKFFYFGMAVYLVVCVLIGLFSGYGIAIDIRATSNVLERMRASAPAAVAFCLAMVFLGAAVQYLLNTAIYKFPLAKAAFGSGTTKKLV